MGSQLVVCVDWRWDCRRVGCVFDRGRRGSMSTSACHLSRFSPEFQLACVCCRVSPTDADQAEIRRLLGLVDVPAFVDMVVRRHRVGSIAHAVLSRLPAQDLPPGLMEPLSEAARHNAVKALQAKRTHIMLARWFAEAGIDWLPFKGLTVAQRYYDDFAQRQVNDLDIWVPKSNLLQARALLEAHGFRMSDAELHWDLAKRGPQHLDYLLRYYLEEKHYCREFGALELHWQVTANSAQFSIAPQTLLDRAETIELGGVPMRVMNDVDLLLYLCDHGGRHGWYRLKWLADLPRLLVDRKWDWQQVFARARQAGCMRALLLGLALSEDLFGVVHPAEVTRELCGRWFLSLTRPLMRVKLQVHAESFEASGHYPVAHRILDVIRGIALSQNLRAALKHLWRYSLSPNDLKVVNLPDRWFEAYYALRPVLFVARQWRALVSK